MQRQPLQIPDNRTLPQKIREAKEKQNLAIFLGAGFPKLFGCWLWEQLAEGFLDTCQQNGVIDARERKNHQDLLKEHKKTALDVITFCYKELVKRGFQNEVARLLQASCRVDPNLNDSLHDAYKQLRHLGDYFITTNYDEHFDNLFQQNSVFYKPAHYFSLDWTGKALDRDTLYHIHGSIKDVETIALTYENYAERESNSNYISFLKNLFCHYTVLFVGTEIEPYLGSILRVVKKQGGCNGNFLLKNYFSDEQEEYLVDKAKFDEHNIEVISIIGDKKEFHELITIIKSWNNEFEEMGLELK